MLTMIIIYIYIYICILPICCLNIKYFLTDILIVLINNFLNNKVIIVENLNHKLVIILFLQLILTQFLN